MTGLQQAPVVSSPVIPAVITNTRTRRVQPVIRSNEIPSQGDSLNRINGGRGVRVVPSFMM